MTEMQDPVEVYRQSLASAPRVSELHPPTIGRAEVLPYPELSRLWVRVETSTFSAYPDLLLSLRDSDGTVVSTLYIVEVRESYQSLTLHLRQPPRPGEQYRLQIELSRNGETLDTRQVDFELTFRELPDVQHQR
jgi:hypothetical protein